MVTVGYKIGTQNHRKLVLLRVTPLQFHSQNGQNWYRKLTLSRDSPPPTADLVLKMEKSGTKN